MKHFLIIVLLFTLARPAFSEETQISSREFLNTKAAKHFIDQKYSQALKELRVLEEKYPNDLLIKRYIGITLDRLGRYDEALKMYRTTLEKSPGNIPIHYAMAETLLRQKNFEGAREELDYVIRHDETGAYKARAGEELRATEKIIIQLKQTKSKKWSFYGSGGAEYNTNATSESRVPEFGSQLHQSAWRFFNSFGGNYEFWKKGPWSANANYNYAHSFYSDSLSQLNTISNYGGANLTYIKIIRGKPLVVQLGHTTAHTLVRDDYYSTSLIQTLNVIYSVTDWYRVTVSDRFSISTFEREGSEPDVTSRDGIGNLVQITNHFYINKKRNLYYLLGFDLQRDVTQGVNYIRNAFAIRTGFHFPVWFSWEADLLFKFRESEYPKFSAPAVSELDTQPERRDEEYTFDFGLSKKLTPRWTLNGNYRLVMTDSQNDLYTYTNNALGFSLSYNY